MQKARFRKALILEYWTIGYHVFEGALSLIAGYLAGSIALEGFGLDSAVEALSGAIVIWRLRKHGSVTGASEEAAEKRAVRFIGYTLVFLGAYVFYEAVKKLLYAQKPAPSLFGIAIAVFSLMVMPMLAYLKYRLAASINSRAMVADTKQTVVCALLSAALLIGLGLNYLYGMWWADPACGLLIVAFIMKEGFGAVREGEF